MREGYVMEQGISTASATPQQPLKLQDLEGKSAWQSIGEDLPWYQLSGYAGYGD
jgi:hypothetical protein